MYTPSKAYVKKISSGTILALLAFSGLLFIIPVATPIFAANASLPSISVTGNNPALGNTAGQVFSMTVSNPTSNQFTVTGFTMNAPTGWTVTHCTAGGFLVDCVFSGNSVTYTVSEFEVGTGAGIPPGGSDTMEFTATSPAGTYPFTSTFTSKVQDASSVAFYTGPSFSIQVIDPTTTITSVTPALSANYVAGSAALTETATLNLPEAGVPIVFTAPGYGISSVFSFTPATAYTNSAGTATTTFQPSNTAGDATEVEAAVGTSSVPTLDSAGTITTVNGPPTEVTWAFGSSQASTGNHYITAEGTTTHTGASATTFTGAEQDTTIKFSLADKFGNTVELNSPQLTAYSFTLTALSGGGLFDATNLPSVITCTNGADWFAGSQDLGTGCPSGAISTVPLPFPYFQSPTWGTIGQLSAAVSGTYAGSPFAGAGQSKLLFTSTFAAASPTPTVVVPSGVTIPHALPNVPAGDNVNVTTTLAIAQPGVPVQLYLDQATSWETMAGAKDYGASSMLPAGFSGAMSTSVTTNGLGQASALFTLDTVAGASAFFQANVTKITDLSPNVLTISGDSAAAACMHGIGVAPVTAGPASACTDSGVAATFTVLTYFDNTLTTPASHAATGATIYVDVTISDAYGNVATNTAVTQIQIALTASCAATCPLSATNVYIPSGGSDTFSSFGPITWTMPGTISTVTLSASGVLSGKSHTSAPDAIGVVSPLPTLAITAPTPMSGVIYSNTASVVFTGQANTSIGYAAPPSAEAVTIASVTYQIDGGAVQTAPIASAYDVIFSVAATFTQGLHTISFNTTDTAGNTAVGQKYQVLVDSAAPTMSFLTANDASVGYGQSVTAWIVAAQGDLNASSVTVTINGTAALASQFSITGTNTLGKSVNYTITITGLIAGTDVLGLSASTLAGLSGTATGITVTVTVPISQSVVITAAAYGTLGSFNGISASATNVWSTSQNLVVFAVWKNSAGQTVAVTTGGLTLNSGASGTAFAPLAGALASGTYTVSVFAITTGNLPVSSTTSITANQ